MTEPVTIGDATLYLGDCLASLTAMPAGDVQTCVTSPPYFGLRDYGCEGQIGLEATPDEFVAKLVVVFREVRRVLRDDGTLWLNLGDSYSNFRVGQCGQSVHDHAVHGQPATPRRGVAGLKEKDLIGIPWMVAFALRADGWYLRQDIIWSKPNPMPESVRDRCTKAHEYLFLLSKSERYRFDQSAIKEPASPNTNPRISAAEIARITAERAAGANTSVGSGRASGKVHPVDGMVKSNTSFENACCLPVDARNRRSVWTVATQPYAGAHFATFPPDLIEPCILAGCPKGGVVLDPFAGSGTTGAVALKHGRKAVLCELNEEYAGLIRERLGVVDHQPDMFLRPHAAVREAFL